MTKIANVSRAGYLRESFHYFHLRDTAGQERDFHYHEFDKLVLLLSGKVAYTIEDSTYYLKPWDVLLVKHHSIHRALIDKSEPYDRIILYLDRNFFERALPGSRIMESFDAADRGRQYLLSPDEEQQDELQSAISSFESTMTDTRPGAQTVQEAKIIQLLVQISRMSASSHKDESGQRDPRIQQVLSYINENLASTLSVDVLAAQVYLSRYHFMRLFKTETGFSVHAYVQQKRLLSAARLIREGAPAGKAAQDSGFSDYSSFHRAFIQSFGVSPGSLKK